MTGQTKDARRGDGRAPPGVHGGIRMGKLSTLMVLAVVVAGLPAATAGSETLGIGVGTTAVMQDLIVDAAAENMRLDNHCNPWWIVDQILCSLL